MPGETASGGDADLLAENRPHGQFEAIPCAGRPQPGTPRNQGRKQRIAREMSADRFDVRAQIEHSAHSTHNRGQEADLWKPDPNAEAMTLRYVRDLDGSDEAANLNRSQVATVLDDFNAGYRTRLQIGEHGVPVIGRAIPEQERDSPAQARRARGGFSPQSTGRTMKQFPKYLIKPPHTAESRGERHFHHGHSRFMNELLGEKYAAGLCYRDGRGPQMLHEQSPELASTHAETRGQGFNALTVAVKGAIGDQSERPGNGIRTSAPGCQIGSRLRPATQARTKTCVLRRCRRPKKAAILEFRGAGRADRPAIDAGGGDANKEQAIKARIAALKSSITDLSVWQLHGPILSRTRELDSRFSDIIISPGRPG